MGKAQGAGGRGNPLAGGKARYPHTIALSHFLSLQTAPSPSHGGVTGKCIIQALQRVWAGTSTWHLVAPQLLAVACELKPSGTL